MSISIEKVPYLLGKIPVLGEYLNTQIINRIARAIPSDYGPFSMDAQYTTWQGLTDRKIYRRFLPRNSEYTECLPNLDIVANLFRQDFDFRENNTSLLFPIFSAWLIDGFLHTKWKPPGEQDFVNSENLHQIGLAQIYGSHEEQTKLLRSFDSGLLKSQYIDGNEYPVFLFEKAEDAVRIKPEFYNLYKRPQFDWIYRDTSDKQKIRFFAAGLVVSNVFFGHSLMNVLFLREHNRIARKIADRYPEWDDERIFQTTRNINIVSLLNIIVSDFLVHLSPVKFPFRIVPGLAEKGDWYRTNWNTVEHALLYRWHSLIPRTVKFNGISRDAWFLRYNSSFIMECGLDDLYKQISGQRAGKLTLGNTPDGLIDVEKVSIMMARTCQLQPYNAYRRLCGLKEISSFDKLTSDKGLARRLEALYENIDNLEFFVGIFAEEHSANSIMGELMATLVANHLFTLVFTNPLLAKNVFNESTFSEVGMDVIRETNCLADIVVRNTGINDTSEVGFELKKNSMTQSSSLREGSQQEIATS